MEGRFKRVHKKGRGAYDLSAIYWICKECGGRPRPASNYAMTGAIKYCNCK